MTRMPSSPMPCLVLCNCPDAQVADTLAEAVVVAGLAACVNILAPCVSIYRWQGQIERAIEIPLLIKTTEAAYPALEAKLRALHPYEVPEIIQLPISEGLPAYLHWLNEQVTPPLIT